MTQTKSRSHPLHRLLPCTLLNEPEYNMRRNWQKYCLFKSTRSCRTKTVKNHFHVQTFQLVLLIDVKIIIVIISYSLYYCQFYTCKFQLVNSVFHFKRVLNNVNFSGFHTVGWLVVWCSTCAVAWYVVRCIKSTDECLVSRCSNVSTVFDCQGVLKLDQTTAVGKLFIVTCRSLIAT